MYDDFWLIGATLANGLRLPAETAQAPLHRPYRELHRFDHGLGPIHRWRELVL
jgi:hypothetical protein